MPWTIRDVCAPADEVWRRWKQGEAFSEIGRALGTTRQVIHGVVVRRGGVAPRPQRRRAGSLQLSEREEISRGLAAGKTLRQIAWELGRAPSTISREVKRNKSQRGYRAHSAQFRTQRRARRPKPCLLEANKPLRALVIEKLKCNWSPRQISPLPYRTVPRRSEYASVARDDLSQPLHPSARGAQEGLDQALTHWAAYTSRESGERSTDPCSRDLGCHTH